MVSVVEKSWPQGLHVRALRLTFLAQLGHCSREAILEISQPTSIIFSPDHIKICPAAIHYAA
jgi:hypothetical protein